MESWPAAEQGFLLGRFAPCDREMPAVVVLFCFVLPAFVEPFLLRVLWDPEPAEFLSPLLVTDQVPCCIKCRVCEEG